MIRLYGCIASPIPCESSYTPSLNSCESSFTLHSVPSALNQCQDDREKSRNWVNLELLRQNMMIELDELRVVKGGRTICHVSRLAIASGERVAILGPNGSGKTTLLRVLAGLETDYAGRCTIDALWRDRVYVHQSPYLFRGTVMFNATYGLRVRGVNRTEGRRRANELLERLGLSFLARQRVTNLSGGERRRVALARALILRPRLLLLDEPLADLDDDGVAAVSAALEELPESTVLVASPTILPSGLTSREFLLQGA